MKFMLLAIFVFFFVVAPMYLLDTQVLSGLSSLQQTYANAGAIAEQAAVPTSVSGQ